MQVWEWVKFSKKIPKKRLPPAQMAGQRGGSFIDSADGQFNHAVATSTQQVTEKNNAANNIGP